MDSIGQILASSTQALTTAQRVFGNDIANANTPGFLAQGVRFQTLLNGTVAAQTVTARGAMTANGNGVDLEATLLALQQTTYALQGVETLWGMRSASEANAVTSLQGA
jgi:flagellar basal body rod protein FlgB